MDRIDETAWSDWIRARDDPSTARGKPEALDDITILDLSSSNYAGCYCTSMLSEFGAEVVRVEPTSAQKSMRM